MIWLQASDTEVQHQGGDAHRALGLLRARGVTVDGDVVQRRGAFGSGPSLYIQDPDGYRIELKPR